MSEGNKNKRSKSSEPTEKEKTAHAAQQKVSDKEAKKRLKAFLKQAAKDRQAGKKRGREMTDVLKKKKRWWENRKSGDAPFPIRPEPPEEPGDPLLLGPRERISA